jgi:hypothetical protein
VTAASSLQPADRNALADLEPLLHRATGLDPMILTRLRLTGGTPGGRDTATALVLLPFGVLVARTVPAPARAAPVDVTVAARNAIEWIQAAGELVVRDGDWRVGLPPPTGWRRVETVPGDVIRRLVRTGAMALKDAAAREGVPGAQPRAQVADALLDSAVLTVCDDAGTEVPVSLRALSALLRMGFLVRGGAAHVDVTGRWTRVVGGHGTVLLERPGRQLRLH